MGRFKDALIVDEEEKIQRDDDLMEYLDYINEINELRFCEPTVEVSGE